MDASGFATLASHFPDRTVVMYDPRALAAAPAETAGSTIRRPEAFARKLSDVLGYDSGSSS